MLFDVDLSRPLSRPICPRGVAVAPNTITARLTLGFAAILGALALSPSVSADESRRRNDSAVAGRPAPTPRAIAPVAPAQRPAAPIYQAAPSYSSPRGVAPGYSYGYVSPRPVYSPPLVVYPAPRIAVIGPPVIYSSPVYSSPVYVFPGYSSSPYYAPAYTPAPVYTYPPAVAQTEPTVYYYCAELQDYYPNVQSCPSNWMRVLPDVAPQQ